MYFAKVNSLFTSLACGKCHTKKKKESHAERKHKNYEKNGGKKSFQNETSTTTKKARVFIAFWLDEDRENRDADAKI